MKSFCLFLLFGALVGCAHISFHEPGQPHKNVGFEYYKPKLYLLVTHNKDGTTKADILTLPDLAQPRYALLHPGYGSSSLSLKVSNGVITEVGQTVDTKIPETITALGSLATAAGGLAARSVNSNDGTAPSFQLYEITLEGANLRLKEVKALK